MGHHLCLCAEQVAIGQVVVSLISTVEYQKGRNGRKKGKGREREFWGAQRKAHGYQLDVGNHLGEQPFRL